MSDANVAELRDLLARAIPGPWTAPLEMPNGHVLINGPGYLTIGSFSRLTDAALIVALVNNADALLDAAEAVAKVTALADNPHEAILTGGIRHNVVDVADLRAALVAPDNHNKETP